MAELWTFVEEPTIKQITGYHRSKRLFQFGFRYVENQVNFTKQIKWFGAGAVGDLLRAVPPSLDDVVRVRIPYLWRDQLVRPGSVLSAAESEDEEEEPAAEEQQEGPTGGSGSEREGPTESEAEAEDEETDTN